MEIYNHIKNKFIKNFETSQSSGAPLLEETEFKAQLIYSFGEKLSHVTNSKTQQEVCQIFNELFSDITVSIYLNSCSINNPSKILLRRILELGIASIYFWDLPQEYWGWKNIESYETDISFKKNIDLLSSQSYIEFLKNEHAILDWNLNHEKREAINRVYRNLSNIIHGKHGTFETITTNLFDYDEAKYIEGLKRIINCENIILSCLIERFPLIYVELKGLLPATERYTYGY